MRSTTRCALLAGLFLILGGTVATAPIAAPSAQQPAQNHTLVIVTANSTATYSVSVSGSLSPIQPEKQDRITGGHQMAGSVGTVNKVLDLHDEIHYTGYIQSFSHQGKVRVRLDGKDVDPSIISKQHINISYPRNSSRLQPIQYQISVSNATTTGEETERNDSASGSTIKGQVSRSDPTDEFYFGGTISNQSWGNATVLINGQPARKFINNDAPTPPPTTQSGTQSGQATITTTGSGNNTDTGSGSQVPQQGSTQSGSGFFDSAFLIGLVGGFVLLVVAGVIMLLYIDYSAR